MDDAGTSVLADATGHGHNALTGGTSMPLPTAGIHGGAAHFDGDDFASIADAPDLDVTTITLAAWAKAETTPPQFAQIVSRQFSTGNEDTWLLGYRGTSEMMGTGAPSQTAFRTMTTGSTLELLGVQSVPDVNTWVHLAATFDGTSERLYRNGVEIASRSLQGSLVPETSRIVIGAGDNGPAVTDEFFTGSIDDLQIYATALSPADIATLATP